MVVTGIIYILVISTSYLMSVDGEEKFHIDRAYNCPSRSNTVQIDVTEYNVRSISLLSPCYPDSYYGQCKYQRKLCLALIYNIPDNMWIGLYVDEVLPVNELRDQLQLTTYNSTPQRFILNSLNPGYLHHFTHYNDNSYIIAFLRYPYPLNTTAHENNLFKIDTIMAYVLGGSYGGDLSAPAGSGGYIVSHEMFDYGRDSNNYYLDDIDVELTLTGPSVNDTIRLSFLFFDLYFYSSRWGTSYCSDYLEVSGIRGYPNNTVYLCGYDEPTNYVYDLYPIGENITFKLIIASHLFYRTAAGFLLEYKVITGVKCPPKIQNADNGTQTDELEIYNITCREGYWTVNRSTMQRVDCSSDRWRTTVLPCVPIQCELPEISNSSELNFTLSSTGRATVGTKISYFCTGERYELTDGTEISTCTPDGEWSSPVPNCTLRKDSLTSTMSADGTVAGYIAGGVGAATALVLFVIAAVLLFRRHKDRPTDQPASDVFLADVLNASHNSSEPIDSSTAPYETALTVADTHLYETTNLEHSIYENTRSNTTSEPTTYEPVNRADDSHMYEKLVKVK